MTLFNVVEINNSDVAELAKSFGRGTRWFAYLADCVWSVRLQDAETLGEFRYAFQRPDW